MSQELIKKVESKFLKKDVPTFNVGDAVKVYAKVVEGEKERTQVFEGIVIAKKHGGLRESFVVRKVSYGIGVEKSFMLHSPNVEKVEVIRKGKAKRAKLYYLRDKIGKLVSHVKEKF
ncbi:50S ribosomal protein L19 [Thermodesulfobium sp.]|jgi:large subunit ribosomal protein L19|uniref:Large ribosomal subunit protein bL19 n=1 Tax=Thermodesulfobium narugense TaxID=184064 RepID=A0A7C5KCR0_9BACT